MFDVFGIQLQFLVAPAETGNQTSLYKGMLPSGAVISLYSHPDSEVFYVFEGTLEVYQESGEYKGWHSLLAGNALAIPPGGKHALRNTSSAPVAAIAVTARGLYEFFAGMRGVQRYIRTVTPNRIGRGPAMSLPRAKMLAS